MPSGESVESVFLNEGFMLNVGIYIFFFYSSHKKSMTLLSVSDKGSDPSYFEQRKLRSLGSNVCVSPCTVPRGLVRSHHILVVGIAGTGGSFGGRETQLSRQKQARSWSFVFYTLEPTSHRRGKHRLLECVASSRTD